MDILEARDLRTLMGQHEGPCVSVFLPTHVAGEEAQQDALRLRNLLDQAESQCIEAGLRAADARDLLAKARRLPTDAAYWIQRNHGLALFVAPGFFRNYRLSWSFDELAFVGNRFLIRPLLPLLDNRTKFYLLALSQNKVQFFQADRHHLRQLEIPGVAANMNEALNYTDADPGSQVHTGMQGRLGKQAAVFHGQGGEPDARKDDLENFFRLVDSGLQTLLRDERAPLLLAGVDYLIPIYRRVNRYPHLANGELNGNCDYLAPHELHQRALPTIEPVLDQDRQRAAGRYRKALGTDKAIHDPTQIVPAARQGRVEILFLADKAPAWGVLDDDPAKIVLHEQREPGDVDLLDEAATATLANGGEVFAVNQQDMPAAGPAAALLRY